jgi:hypothetical protein
MPELTQQGQKIVGDLANRHGFSTDAVQHMLVAVMNGNGQMAQFSHPEFAGSGQWMSGGMTMIGDMFNNYLKGRIQSLCADIASTLQQQGTLFQSGSFQSQSQNGLDSQSQMSGGVRGNSSLFVPDPSQNWWPAELGSPNATGSQNQTRYAYFGDSCRLAVKTGSSVWVYDTLQHRIGGFSQQQGAGGSITFSSQFGTVHLSSLPVVMRDGQLITPIPLEHQNAAVVVPSTFELENSESRPSSIENSGESPTNPATPANFDVFASIEKLGDLNAKGILTDEEFSEKKKELLARL